VNHRLLGERSVHVAHRRAGPIRPAVQPGVEDRRAGLDVVVVALEVVHHDEFLRREAPDGTRPRGDRLGLVDLVDPPVVGRIHRQHAGIVEAVGHRGGRRRAVNNSGFLRAQVHLVRSRLAAGTPIQNRPDLHVRRSGLGLRLAGHHGDVHELDLAEPELAHHPVAALGRQADVFGRHTLEVHDRVGLVAHLGGAAREHEVAQGRPGLTVGGVLDRGVLEPEPEHQLEHHVVVPDAHLVNLVDAVELALQPHRLTAAGRQPHIRRLDRVLAGRVKPGPVDRVLRPGLGFHVRDVAGGDDVRHRIGERLGGEAPHLALEDRVVRRRVDLVDAPVIRRLKLQTHRRRVRRARLPLADQHPQRIAPARRIHIGERGPKIHIVRRRELTGRPADDDIPRHVGRLVRRQRSRCKAGTEAAHHRLNLAVRQHDVVDPQIVHGAVEIRIGVVLRPADPVLRGFAQRIDGVGDVRHRADALAVEVQFHPLRTAADGDRHMVPAERKQTLARIELVPDAVVDGDGDAHRAGRTIVGTEI